MLYFSVIIANFNGEAYLPNCLTSLLKSKFKNFEVLIIDNNSNDLSLKIATKFSEKDKRIRMIRNKVNLGVPVSRNIAIKSARGEILIFLDNDTEMDKNWLDELAKTFHDKTITAAQPLIFDFHNRDLIQEAGMRINPYTGFGMTIGRGEKDLGQYKSLEIISLGAALAVRKDVAKRVAGFDVKLFHCTDDLDFCWRLWLQGFKVVLSDKSKIYHYTKSHPATSRLYFHLSKNSLRMLTKNYELSNLLKFLPVSLILLILGGFYVLLFKHTFKGLYGVILGITWYILTLKDTLKERIKIQKNRKRSDEEILSRVMISKNLLLFFKNYIRLSREISLQVESNI